MLGLYLIPSNFRIFNKNLFPKFGHPVQKSLIRRIVFVVGSFRQAYRFEETLLSRALHFLNLPQVRAAVTLFSWFASEGINTCDTRWSYIGWSVLSNILKLLLGLSGCPPQLLFQKPTLTRLSWLPFQKSHTHLALTLILRLFDWNWANIGANTRNWCLNEYLIVFRNVIVDPWCFWFNAVKLSESLTQKSIVLFSSVIADNRVLHGNPEGVPRVICCKWLSDRL